MEVVEILNRILLLFLRITMLEVDKVKAIGKKKPTKKCKMSPLFHPERRNDSLSMNRLSVVLEIEIELHPT